MFCFHVFPELNCTICTLSVFWPGEFYGLCNPWGHKELDTTEWLSLSYFHFPVFLPQEPHKQFICAFLHSVAQLCMTLWPHGLSLTISQSFPKFMFAASVMPSSHLIPWCPFLLLPSIFPSIRDFPNELTVPIRWPKYWSFVFSISPSSAL